MPITVRQTATAMRPRLRSSFGAVGGVEPYTFEVVPDGAGGTIDEDTGAYTAPAVASSNPDRFYDTILVTDAVDETAEARILIAEPILLIMEILRREMALAEDQVRLWQQKIFQPTDGRLYIAVSNPSGKPFANINRAVSLGESPTAGMEAAQFVTTTDRIELDVISRTLEAMNRKLDPLFAFRSNYAAQQMARNSFYIASLPYQFNSLSHLDGTVIPYRYKLAFNLQWSYARNQAVDYFNNNFEPTIIVDP